MIHEFSFYLGIIVIITLLVMLSEKIRIAYPILLLLAGIGISFIPNIPVIRIDPELIFVIFLPPLLYEAAWANSWKEIWKWRRIIFSFAFIVVFLTAIAVAFATNYFIPGFSLALGFLLGGIVSPPDAVSAGSILKFVKVPKRIATLLEGESLFNDASSLIIVRFALVAVGTGQFIWQQALISFSWMIFGGIGIGLLIAFVIMHAHKRLPTNANIDVIFTLVAPYIMYITAEELHASGVMSVVCGGLFLSYHNFKFLTSSSRLQGIAVWHSLGFALNGLVFMLIGLDLPEIMAGLHKENINLWEVTGYGLLVTAILIIARIIAAYGSVFITKILGKVITVADKNPDLKAPAIVGWAGMRGVVSLAAVLSIPNTLEDGTPFPHRSMILFITFIVILVTLILQGLTLPILIKKIKLKEYEDHIPEQEAEAMILNLIGNKALSFFSEKYQDEIPKYPMLKQMENYWEERLAEECKLHLPERAKEIYKELLHEQRIALAELNNTYPQIDEEIIRKHINKIDIEETRINHY